MQTPASFYLNFVNVPKSLLHSTSFPTTNPIHKGRGNREILMCSRCGNGPFITPTFHVQAEDSCTGQAKKFLVASNHQWECLPT